jgi:hypothetical protein
MKKAIFTLFAASLLLVSCNKGINPGDVVFPDPATKAYAMSVVFDMGEPLYLDLPERSVPNNPASTTSGKTSEVDIVGIDLTDDSRYALYIGDKNTKAGFPKKPTTVWMGKFQFTADVYQLEGFGDVYVKDSKTIVIRPKATKANQESYELKATITKFAELSAAAANLARNWKVESTYIKVKGGKDNISASQSFTGCDLHAIARALKEKKVNLSDEDVDKLDGFEITELNFIGNNNVVMNFNGPESYYGTWTVSGNNITWELNNSNKLIAAKATGTVSFPSSNKAVLIMNAEVSHNDEKYAGTIEFTLSHAN